ncbi:phosphoribosylamine--glycine ligase [Xenococcus sp. PCC 7305]|uniref:phosphoribosylamine--glycine ligase n=1 Tax=Xenococcus sp. PCC 7305 TaxID=102125 RepID=UPI0002ABB4F4|nr:phosphoribosylamine--glycine ligase [Xenococcus sp. PCC 7305]ELS01487.1 phosphoribosylamine--glycine ligase [Xenococcus sp. PCC 7305]
MNILVVGSGGREHAIAGTLLRSPNVQQVFCAPGNGGTATMANCRNLDLAVDDFPAIAQAVQEYDISLVVVGPEVPLALGITDYLQANNVLVFGPVKAGAQIEASKSWAKDLMAEAGIPTAKSATFTDAEAAKAYIKQEGAPIVVKADSLAAGKGVIVAMNLESAIAAVDDLFNQGFNTLVIEDFLVGEEASVLALTDGQTIIPLLPAQDHKRIGEGDTGKNTGGMGAYAPAPLVTPEIMQRIQTEVLQPTIDAFNKRGIDYRGILYAGLIITPQGEPKVIEFNCRFGDPETQAVLPLLETPLEQLMLACAQQKLAEQPPLAWKPGIAICVVASSGGYPDAYEKGKAITGIESIREAMIFHAGTKLENSQLLTNGGRVLGITAIGDDFESAIAKVYSAVSAITFEGLYYRRDIGHRFKQ